MLSSYPTVLPVSITVTLTLRNLRVDELAAFHAVLDIDRYLLALPPRNSHQSHRRGLSLPLHERLPTSTPHQSATCRRDRRRYYRICWVCLRTAIRKSPRRIVNGRIECAAAIWVTTSNVSSARCYAPNLRSTECISPGSTACMVEERAYVVGEAVLGASWSYVSFGKTKSRPQ